MYACIVSELLQEIVRRCVPDNGGCDHVCEDNPSGIQCSCYDGYRANGTSCLGIYTIFSPYKTISFVTVRFLTNF